jgi:hypothetical protein
MYLLYVCISGINFIKNLIVILTCNISYYCSRIMTNTTCSFIFLLTPTLSLLIDPPRLVLLHWSCYEHYNKYNIIMIVMYAWMIHISIYFSIYKRIKPSDQRFLILLSNKIRHGHKCQRRYMILCNLSCSRVIIIRPIVSTSASTCFIRPRLTISRSVIG